eukprot:jgi/Botrbrau1/151/Bobra.0022s0136.1
MHKYSMISVRAILRQVSDRSFSVHTQRTPGNSKMKFQLSLYMVLFITCSQP